MDLIKIDVLGCISFRIQIINIDIWSGNSKSIFTTVVLNTKIFKYTKLVLIEKQGFNFSKIRNYVTALKLRY